MKETARVKMSDGNVLVIEYDPETKMAIVRGEQTPVENKKEKKGKK